MMLKWRDLFYGENFIDKIDHATILSVWGLEDWQEAQTSDQAPPNYAEIHGCDTVIWSDGRKPGTPDHPDEAYERQLAHFRDAGDARTVFVLTTSTTAPGRDCSYGGHHVHRIRCVGMWLLNDQGDTIQRVA